MIKTHGGLHDKNVYWETMARNSLVYIHELNGYKYTLTFNKIYRFGTYTYWYIYYDLYLQKRQKIKFVHYF